MKAQIEQLRKLRQKMELEGNSQMVTILTNTIDYMVSVRGDDREGVEYEQD